MFEISYPIACHWSNTVTQVRLVVAAVAGNGRIASHRLRRRRCPISGGDCRVGGCRRVGGLLGSRQRCF